MEIFSLFFLLFPLFYLLLSAWRMHRRRAQLPPGPAPLPLVGNVFQGVLVLYQTYPKFWKQYGDVFTIWMGSSPTVVLCGYKTIKEALVGYSHQFGDRGPVPIQGRLSEGYGITSVNGEQWQQTRRFAVTTLRNFGMGKRSMEERVQEEAQHLIQAIEDTAGEAFNPQILLGRAVNNVINLVVFGQRWDYEDKVFLKLLHTMNSFATFVRKPLGVAYAAFNKVMKALPGPHQKFFRDCEEVKSFIKEEIHQHKRSFNPDSPRDLIDCFLIQAEKDSRGDRNIFIQDNLVASIFEMFVAGTETTANTLQFALLAVIKHPHIQERVQKELDEAIGPDRLPGIADRFQMPYTNAVVHEIMRYADILPLALPHKMSEDTNFKGFTIPKGTTVIPLLASALADPEHWKTPHQFDPENFLDEDGKFCKPEAMIPFSIGKRICPGEGLARMEVFLFLTALLQKFTFRPANPTDTFNLAERRRDFRKKGLSYHLIANPRRGRRNRHTS
ncbi:cytochrome P450 2G1-like [Hyperolius riggenbachi]|uniref:cytochrome P450 2G1-like n=1 Tax=Hyperolius riggenbachi TaxID=752182 RepID=UPI0035A2A248